MIIEPRMRGFICLTAQPKGCEQSVKNQIEYVKSNELFNLRGVEKNETLRTLFLKLKTTD